MIDFRGGPGTAELMEAVAVLKEMNRLGGRKVPADAATGFVPAKYAGYMTVVTFLPSAFSAWTCS